MKNIVILISGRGSNMEALIAARDAGNLPVNIVAVISNRPDAAGLETAARAGIVTHYIDHKAFAGREAFDAALAECIDGFAPDLVVLAGFMRILSDGFVRHYEGRLINIHRRCCRPSPACIPTSGRWTKACASMAARCISSRRRSITARSSSRQPCRCSTATRPPGRPRAAPGTQDLSAGRALVC
jgi:hypothetical protein